MQQIYGGTPMAKYDFNKVAKQINRKEHPCWSVISIKLLSEIALRHGCSPKNLLRIFRKTFYKYTSGDLCLVFLKITEMNFRLLYLLYISYTKLLSCEARKLYSFLGNLMMRCPWSYLLKTRFLFDPTIWFYRACFIHVLFILKTWPIH